MQQQKLPAAQAPSPYVPPKAQAVPKHLVERLNVESKRLLAITPPPVMHKEHLFNVIIESQIRLPHAFLPATPHWWGSLPSNPKRIAIVGNGRIPEPLGAEIDAHCIVVRFNDFSDDVERVGGRTDVHLIQHVAAKNKACHGPRTLYFYKDRCPPGMTSVHMHKHMYTANSTLGFRSIPVLMNTWKEASFDLYGFNGVGHHHKPSTVDMPHGVLNEHSVLRTKDRLRLIGFSSHPSEGGLQEPARIAP